MIRNRLWLFFFFILVSNTVFSQESIQSIIEEIVEGQNVESDSGEEFTSLVEALMDLSVNKINMNSAVVEDFKAIPFLTALQINNLITYRKRHGKLVNVYELLLIEGFDEKTIRWLSAFVAFDVEKEKPDLKRLWWQHELIARTKTILQNQEGYQRTDSTRYLGNPYQYYLRYVVSNKWGEAGVTMEKDPGEPFLKYGNSSGFDYYSAHAFVKNIGVIRKLNIGDYSLRFGQGLNLWSGFSFGKSLLPNTGQKYGNGIMPYKSVAESNYFRGVATELYYKNLSLSVFYSNHKLDGTEITTIDSLDTETDRISSVYQNGYHRTFKEFEKKHNLKEVLWGGNLKYNINRLMLGLTLYTVGFDKEINPDNQLHNQFAFRGKQNFVKGADFFYASHHAEYFGEISLDKNNYAAGLIGANFYLDPAITLNVLYRNYHQKYNNHYAAGFGEYGHTKNESGLFAAVTFGINKNWSFSGYADFFSNKSARFALDSPSRGAEYACRLNFIPNRESLLYVKLFFEDKAKNVPQSIPIQEAQKVKRTKIRLHFRKNIRQFEIKSRITKTIVKKSNTPSHGFLIYQDVNYTFERIPLKLYGRIALFDTDDYASRVYAYEHDMLYAFSFPAYYYSGNRFYVMAKYQWHKISFWLRFSSTQYHHKDKILSGLNEIKGNRVSEIKFQVRWKF